MKLFFCFLLVKVTCNPDSATDWTVRCSRPSEARVLTLLQNFLTGSGIHPASYAVGTGEMFLGDKAAEARSYLFLVSRLKLVELYLHPHICLYGVYKDNF
jgi:hypothetical protein